MKALSLYGRPLFFWPPAVDIDDLLPVLQTNPQLLDLKSRMFLLLSSLMVASLARAFSLLVIFSLVVALTCKIVLDTSVARALRPIVAEVNWEGCHHRDRCNHRDHCSLLLPDCMILVEKVSE
jgi:hypothetical protein